MQRTVKFAVSATTLIGLFALGAPAQAKSPANHQHHHSSAPKAAKYAKPSQNGSHHGQTHARDRRVSTTKCLPPLKKNKAQQAKEIHDKRMKDWPIFVPTSKAQQAKEIHDQRVKDARNGGPIFVPTSKAQQASDIYHERMKDPRKKSKAQQASDIYHERMKQQQHQNPWDGYQGNPDNAPAWLKDAWGPPPR